MERSSSDAGAQARLDGPALKAATCTRQTVFGQIAGVLGAGDITDETWEDLEALLIQADVGVPTTVYLVDTLRERVRREGLYRAEQLLGALRSELRALLTDPPVFEMEQPRLLTVVMVVGVNGSGKTTTIGKLAQRYNCLLYTSDAADE